MAREYTEAELRYLAKSNGAADASRRLAIIERPAPVVAPAPSEPVAAKWALYSKPNRQIRGADTVPSDPPVLVELLRFTPASLHGRVSPAERMDASWAGVEYPSLARHSVM